MADFCRRCSEELFGKEYADSILIDIEDDEFLILLCEGCGRNVRVDNKGNVLECNTCIYGNEGICDNLDGIEGYITEIAGEGICKNFELRSKNES